MTERPSRSSCSRVATTRTATDGLVHSFIELVGGRRWKMQIPGMSVHLLSGLEDQIVSICLRIELFSGGGRSYQLTCITNISDKTASAAKLTIRIFHSTLFCSVLSCEIK